MVWKMYAGLAVTKAFCGAELQSYLVSIHILFLILVAAVPQQYEGWTQIVLGDRDFNVSFFSLFFNLRLHYFTLYCDSWAWEIVTRLVDEILIS